MQHRLAPDFILDSLTNERFNGRFSGSAMFLDVSGFSTIMDTLMQYGQHGSEIMATLMRTLFSPLVASVYAHDGYIVGFAGDAFTAVFPNKHSTHSALAAALEMQHFLEGNNHHDTEYGSFPIGAKVGLAYGEIEWGILRSTSGQRATFYYKGAAVQHCSDAEHFANKREIVCHATFFDRVKDEIDVENREDFYKITAVRTPLPPPNPLHSPNQSPDLMSHFFPLQLITQSISGEFRQILNLFINIEGTPTPNQLSQFMQSVFTLQDRYGGLLNRIDFGDKGCHLLFFWGAPISYENDIFRVLNFVNDLKSLTNLKLRMGITYRIAHAGFIGSELHEEYTCYGRGVNLAARFMTNADWGEIWVDAEIAERAKQQFRFEFLDEKPFKGFAATQAVYLMQGRRQIARTPFFEGELVGRQKELAQIRGMIEPLMYGRFAGVAIISGEAGIGKSRLIHDFLEKENLHDRVKVLLCQTDEILRQTLNPYRYWLRDYFNQSPSADEAANRATFDLVLDQLIAETAVPAKQKELDRTRSFLGALLGLSWPNSLYEQLEPQLRFENTLTALKGLIKAEASRQPLILQLEDAQWMDEESRRFLHQLTRNINDVPLLILITTRDPFPEDGLADDVTRLDIPLSHLEITAVQTMVEQQMGHPPHASFMNWLVQRTGGHPFFVEQMLLYLKENQLAEQVARRPDLLSDSNVLPTDVRSVLTARLDRLPTAVREAVQTAAVLGREFDHPVIATMLDPTIPTDPTLRRGMEESIWVALSQLRYLFRHMMLRDAAYEMQVHSRLKTLHHQAANAFESVYATDLAPYYGEIAYHFDRATVMVRAIDYYEKAADQARDSYQNKEALAYYGRALSLLTPADSDQYIRLLLGKESILNWLGRRDEQREVLSDLEKALETDPDQAMQAELALRQAALALSVGNYPHAIEAASRSAEMAQSPLSEALAYHRWGRAHWSQGHTQKARPLLEKAQTLLHDTQLQKEKALVLYDLGIIDYYELKFEAALHKLEEAFTINQDSQNKQGVISCLSMTGLVYSAQGNYEKSHHQLEQALTICQEVGWRFGEVRTLTQIGNSYFELGDYGQSKRYLQEAQAIFGEINDREGQSASLDTLGLVYFFEGELETAVTTLQTAIDLDEQTDNRRNMAYSKTHLGYALTAVHRFDEALATFQDAQSIRQKLQAIGAEMDTLGGLAQLALAQNDLSGALSHVQRILLYVEEEGSSGLELPVFTLLVCVDVLTAVTQTDPSLKPQLQNALEAGQTILQTRAEEIKDEALRSQFLRNVPYNRAFLRFLNG